MTTQTKSGPWGPLREAARSMVYTHADPMGLFRGYIVKPGLLARARDPSGALGAGAPRSALDHAVGGATSSSARPRASGPTCVTATAAIATITAIAANTAPVLQVFWINGIARIAIAAPARPAACDRPKPVARALVGNTSEMKICDELPDSCVKKIMQKPIASTIVSSTALPNRMANTPVMIKATTAVGLRPKRSSAYIMKALAHGKASVIQKIEFSDLAIPRPRSASMFGSQVPSPMAILKNA